jgi:nitrogen fixation protein NifU and related proteins
MSELSDLYQEVILDHHRRPRNYGPLPGASRTAQGHNPLCGDRLTLYVQLEGDRISGISFEGDGCAISKASASLMTDAIKGHSVSEASALFERFHRMITTPFDQEVDEMELGKLAAFAGVRQYPIRVKCASLAWHTLKAALADSHEKVKTE